MIIVTLLLKVVGAWSTIVFSLQLPTQEELKTVLDKVKDFFGNATSGAKESFGKLTSLGSLTDEEPESQSEWVLQIKIDLFLWAV